MLSLLWSRSQHAHAMVKSVMIDWDCRCFFRQAGNTGRTPSTSTWRRNTKKHCWHFTLNVTLGFGRWQRNRCAGYLWQSNITDGISWRFSEYVVWLIRMNYACYFDSFHRFAQELNSKMAHSFINRLVACKTTTICNADMKNICHAGKWKSPLAWCSCWQNTMRWCYIYILLTTTNQKYEKNMHRKNDLVTESLSSRRCSR